MGRKRIHADRKAYQRAYNRAYKQRHGERINAKLRISKDDSETLKCAAVRTYREVAMLLECSKECVRQTERKAIMKIREVLTEYWKEIK